MDAIYDVTVVSDFCSNEIQQLPFSSDYLNTAIQQLWNFYIEMDSSSIPDDCTSICLKLFDRLQHADIGSLTPFSSLVSCYLCLRKLVVILVVCFNVFIDQEHCRCLDRYQLCIDYILNRDFEMGINLGETLLTNSI